MATKKPAPAKKAPARKPPAKKAAAQAKKAAPSAKSSRAKKQIAKNAAQASQPSREEAGNVDKPLNDRQSRFIDEYLVDFNATAAYKRAGYAATGNAAEVGAHQLLRNPKVAAEVAKRQEQTAQKLGITREEALEEAWRIVKADARELIEYRRFACPACYVDGHEGDRRDPSPDCVQCHGDGRADVLVKDTRKFGANARALYAGVKLTKEGLEVKMHSKLDALEKVFKHLGMYDADKPPAANVSVTVAAGANAQAQANLAPGEAYLIMVQGKK